MVSYLGYTMLENQQILHRKLDNLEVFNRFGPVSPTPISPTPVSPIPISPTLDIQSIPVSPTLHFLSTNIFLNLSFFLTYLFFLIYYHLFVFYMFCSEYTCKDVSNVHLF